MKSSSYSGAARPRKRTGADHFGLFTLFLLLAASLALYIRLMATGMLSNLYVQMKDQNMEDRFSDVLKEIPKVREDLGEPPLVTPSS